MSGIPVVIAENGLGVPVVEVEDGNAPLMTVAENGLGMPIVLSTNGIGMPARIEGGGAYLPSVSTAPQAVYGTKKLIAAYEGACCRVVRASDSAEQDIGFSGQAIDMAAATAFAAGSELTIKTLYDQSGNGNDATQSTAGNRPRLRAANAWRGTQGLTFDGLLPGGSPVAKTLTLPAGVVVDRRANSGYVVAGDRANYNNAAEIEHGDATTRLLLYHAPGNAGQQMHYGSGSSPASVTGTRFTRMNPSINAWRAGASSNRVRIDTTEDALTAASAGTNSGGLIGGSVSAGFSARMEFFAFVSYAAALSDADDALVRAALQNIFPVASPNQNDVVVYEGDSITEGTGDTFLQNSPRQQLPLLSRDVHMHNLAVHGTNAATEYARRVAKLAGVSRSVSGKKIFRISLGSNDIAAGTTGANLFNKSVLPYVQYAQGLGYSVIVGTIIPRSGLTAGQETERQAYNALVLSSAAANNYEVADYTALPQFDAQADATNTTYYSGDGVHPNSVGYGLMANVDATAINLALAA